MNFQSGKCQWQAWSKHALKFPDLKDELSFCLHLEWDYFKNSSQMRINFSTSSFMPGQYIVSFALNLHFVKPKCPLCIRWRLYWHFLSGNDNTCSFQDNPIFNCKLLSEGTEWLDLPWNFSNGIGPSMGNCMLQ